MTPVIRGDWAGFALYLEEPDSIEPGECVGLFKTLTGAARARAAADEAITQLAATLAKPRSEII